MQAAAASSDAGLPLLADGSACASRGAPELPANRRGRHLKAGGYGHVEIRADQTLNRLHRTVFKPFGRRDDCHLSRFDMSNGVLDRDGDHYVLQSIYDDPDETAFNDEPEPVDSMERTRMGKLGLQPGQVFWYGYDFCDDWVHRITVLAVGQAEPGTEYPRVEALPFSPLLPSRQSYRRVQAARRDAERRGRGGEAT